MLLIKNPVHLCGGILRIVPPHAVTGHPCNGFAMQAEFMQLQIIPHRYPQQLLITGTRQLKVRLVTQYRHAALCRLVAGGSNAQRPLPQIAGIQLRRVCEHRRTGRSRK
ncbi:MAG: hypothetical protein GY774_34920 [Planctomycetes bacterium]|nr:hypothetical protein [Planctomycetota bacterium]